MMLPFSPSNYFSGALFAGRIGCARPLKADRE